MLQPDKIKGDAINAASIYLNDQEIRVLDTEYSCEAGSVDLVFIEDNTLVFAEIEVSTSNTLPDEVLTASDRVRLEMVAIDYLANHDMPSSPVRFDTLKMAVVGEGRLLLCHRRDALGEAKEQQINRSAEAKRIMDNNKKQPAKTKKPKARER